jgi:FtsZ-interacting cell division protein ZipA
MDTSTLILVIVVVGIVGLLGFFVSRKQRTAHLRDRFGPEYDRVVEKADDRKAAEVELKARERRHSQLELQPLDPASAARYQEQWRETQARFVDSPSTAIQEADELITSVMRDRGYPMDDFEQRAADLSVEHPDVVNRYRAAHRVAMANQHDEASTEDLREAMIHYRSLFERLINSNEHSREGSR